MSCVLTEAVQLKKIALLDGVMQARGHTAAPADAFDADAAIATSELHPFIADLVEALGGEHAPGTCTARRSVSPKAPRQPVPA